MSIIRTTTFWGGVKSFFSTHPIISALSLGIIVFGFSRGNLLGRVVAWISKGFGTTDRTDRAAQEALSQPAAASTQKTRPSIAAEHQLSVKEILELHKDGSNIFIKTAFGKIFSVNVNNEKATGYHLRILIVHQLISDGVFAEGDRANLMDPKKCKLYYLGKEILDAESPDSLNIRKDRTVHIILPRK